MKPGMLVEVTFWDHSITTEADSRPVEIVAMGEVVEIGKDTVRLRHWHAKNVQEDTGNDEFAVIVRSCITGWAELKRKRGKREY